MLDVPRVTRAAPAPTFTGLPAARLSEPFEKLRDATDAMLAKTGACEIVSLHAGATPVAAAIVVRHQNRAFYFKIGIDETFAKFSPGVQLTLDLTRHLCADPFIATADSTADAGHSMIEPIWRGRLRIGDVLLPLYRRDPTAAIAYAALAARIRLRDAARRLRAGRNRRAPSF